MKRPINCFLGLGLVFSTLLGCSSGGDFRGGAIGISRADKGGDDKDDEDEKASEPVEVSGSFLTCAFMDSENGVKDKAKTNPQSSVEIACGLFRTIDSKFTRIDDSKLKLQTRILTNQGKLITTDHRRLPQGSQMQVVINIPVEQLSGTVHIDYYDPSSGSFSSRRKSIPTITEFLASIGFSVYDDDSVEKITSGQLAMNGKPDPEDFVVHKPKLDFWKIIFQIVIAVFGEAAAVPASNDNGATVYKPFVPVRNTQVGQNQAKTNDDVYYPSANQNNSTKPNNNSTNPNNNSTKPNNNSTKPNSNSTQKPVNTQNPNSTTKPTQQPDTTDKVIVVKPDVTPTGTVQDDNFKPVDTAKPTEPAVVIPIEKPEPAVIDVPKTEVKADTPAQPAKDSIETPAAE